jgi:hypothetical protein
LSSAITHLFQEELYRVPANLAVIIPKEWHKILEEEKALLAKILGSVKLSMDSVLIVTQQNIDWDALAVLKPAKVLIFGSHMSGDIKPYESTNLNNITLIKADDLGMLDDNKKKSLWIALKQMFSV